MVPVPSSGPPREEEAEVACLERPECVDEFYEGLLGLHGKPSSRRFSRDGYGEACPTMYGLFKQMCDLAGETNELRRTESQLKTEREHMQSMLRQGAMVLESNLGQTISFFLQCEGRGRGCLEWAQRGFFKTLSFLREETMPHSHVPAHHSPNTHNAAELAQENRVLQNTVDNLTLQLHQLEEEVKLVRSSSRQAVDEARIKVSALETEMARKEGQRRRQSVVVVGDVRSGVCGGSQKVTELEEQLDRIRKKAAAQLVELETTRQQLHDAGLRERQLQRDNTEMRAAVIRRVATVGISSPAPPEGEAGDINTALRGLQKLLRSRTLPPHIHSTTPSRNPSDMRVMIREVKNALRMTQLVPPVPADPEERPKRKKKGGGDDKQEGPPPPPPSPSRRRSVSRGRRRERGWVPVPSAASRSRNAVIDCFGPPVEPLPQPPGSCPRQKPRGKPAVQGQVHVVPRRRSLTPSKTRDLSPSALRCLRTQSPPSWK